MTQRNFKKMHALGNDFIVIDGRRRPFAPTTAQAQFLADRRRGVGCDQIIVLEPATRGDLFMRIFNADGSQAEACGNASRCVASLVYEEGVATPRLETLAGVLTCQRIDGQFQVDMGPIEIIDKARPVAAGPSPAVILTIGNPHCVFLTDQVDLVDDVGPKVEVDPQFPQRTNVQFVQVLGRNAIRQRVWERGAGLTAASGSGACAGAVAAMSVGGCDRQLTVHMDGGDIEITWQEGDGHVLMRGPHSLAFEGVFEERALEESALEEVFTLP